MADDGAWVPIVLDLAFRADAPASFRLEGELACLGALRPGATIESIAHRRRARSRPRPRRVLRPRLLRGEEGRGDRQVSAGGGGGDRGPQRGHDRGRHLPRGQHRPRRARRPALDRFTTAAGPEPEPRRSDPRRLESIVFRNALAFSGLFDGHTLSPRLRPGASGGQGERSARRLPRRDGRGGRPRASRLRAVPHQVLHAPSAGGAALLRQALGPDRDAAGLVEPGRGRARRRLRRDARDRLHRRVPRHPGRLPRPRRKARGSRSRKARRCCASSRCRARCWPTSSAGGRSDERRSAGTGTRRTVPRACRPSSRRRASPGFVRRSWRRAPRASRGPAPSASSASAPSCWSGSRSAPCPAGAPSPRDGWRRRSTPTARCCSASRPTCR